MASEGTRGCTPRWTGRFARGLFERAKRASSAGRPVRRGVRLAESALRGHRGGAPMRCFFQLILIYEGDAWGVRKEELAARARFFSGTAEVDIVGLEDLHAHGPFVPGIRTDDRVRACARAEARRIVRTPCRHRSLAAWNFPASHRMPPISRVFQLTVACAERPMPGYSVTCMNV